MTPMKTISLPRPRGFSLRAASEFYAGFIPGSGMAAASTDGLTFAFHLDGTYEPVVASLAERGDAIEVRFSGTNDRQRLAAQISRVLGLEVDGEAWLALGRRDVVVGRLQAEFPGFFTAAKASPYDAAVWGILSPRISIRAAARIKLGIAEAHGQRLEMDGRVHHVFPSPERLVGLRELSSLPADKMERLRGIAGAALRGRLDADRRRAMDEAEALAELQTLRGVGPWTASHILFRGAAPVDALPLAEPRVLHGFASAAGLESPSSEDFARAAEGWRPFRMWVSILLARHLARTGGWNAPGLSRERRASGDRLRKRERTRVRA
jgi:DNA-3-methyladenine glycosylase II